MKWASTLLLVFALTALLADCLAGERPIVSSVAGKLAWFAGGQGVQAPLLAEKDWALWPPVRWSPQRMRHEGKVAVLQAPSQEHVLGTDDRGRDVASRIIHGLRLSLGLALSCALLASLLGCLLALLAAASRFGDLVVVSFCDTVAAVPPLLAVLVVGGLVGGSSLWALVILISLPRAALTARVVRDGLLGALAQPYCEAARALGCSRLRILTRHALPQCLPQLRVAAGVTASTAVLSEVALSFLGLVAAGSQPSLGELLRQAHENSLLWWLLVPAGLLSSLLAWALGRIAQERY